MTDREDFEKWAKDNLRKYLYLFDQFSGNRYLDKEIQVAWKGWQASEAHYKERIGELEDCLNQIRSWCKAYPLGVFTEPNWKEVNEKLGSTLLTQVSGSNMRHVVTGIQNIINATTKGK
jgi:hypothetical protein